MKRYYYVVYMTGATFGNSYIVTVNHRNFPLADVSERIGNVIGKSVLILSWQKICKKEYDNAPDQRVIKFVGLRDEQD